MEREAACRPKRLRRSRKSLSTELHGWDRRRINVGPSCRKFPNAFTYPCWMTSFKIEACSGSNCASEAVRWINEAEMATSAEGLKTARSIFRKSIPKLRDA